MPHSRLLVAVGVLLLLWGSTPIVAPHIARRPGAHDAELARRRRAAYRLSAAWPLLGALAGGAVVVRLFGALPGSMVLAGAALALSVVSRWRRAVCRFVRMLHKRRRAELALLAAMELHAPTVLGIETNAAGETITVQVRPGRDVASIEAHLGAVAAFLRAREVQLVPDPADAALAELLVVRAEPLRFPLRPAHLLGVPAGAGGERRDRFSLHEPLRIGLDERGEPAEIVLVGSHLLVGGEPGSGKSVSLSVILAHAALDPDTDIWLFDGKLVELDAWRPLAARFVGPDVAAASAALSELRAEMEARYERLLGKARKVQAGDGERLVLVVIDELAFYAATPDKKAAQAFSEVLRDLVARARAAGIVVVAATQKPSSDLVPTALRDLFGFRLAHRCTTRDASDTILGAGWAGKGFDAASIAPALRGVGYLLAEDGIPRRLRTYQLGDEDIAAIVARAVRLREGGAR